MVSNLFLRYPRAADNPALGLVERDSCAGGGVDTNQDVLVLKLHGELMSSFATLLTGFAQVLESQGPVGSARAFWMSLKKGL